MLWCKRNARTLITVKREVNHLKKFSCKTSSNLGSNIKKTITKQKQGKEVYNMTDISASRGKIGIRDNLAVEQLQCKYKMALKFNPKKF
jgi:hypothetical protein